MRIKHLRLVCFRGFEELDLDLKSPVTLLVGPNGSGKSSVLMAIALAYSGRAHGEGELALVPGQEDLKEGASAGEILASFEVGTELLTTQIPLPFPRQTWFLGGTLRGQCLLFFETSRGLVSAQVRETPSPRATKPSEEPINGPWEIDDHAVSLQWPGFDRFLRWFKDREDIENEARVERGDLSLQDPQLRAVREATMALMPGFTRLRIRRAPSPVMVVSKGNLELRLDQLSDGERNLIALTGEIARRMARVASPGENPREVEGVVLIDEIEQHLHPGLQREVLPRLQQAFPRVQWIVTTHSPQVLSTAPEGSVIAIDPFRATPIERSVRGRDSNAILGDVFSVSSRPELQLRKLTAVRDKIDAGNLDEAREELDELARLLSEEDSDILALRMRLFVVENGTVLGAES